MNLFVGCGRLTRNPEVRYTQGQEPTCVARFTLAIDRPKRKNADSSQQTADFISCVAFGRRGEIIEKYCQKGTKLIVEGRVQTGSYTNKNGQKVYTTDVIVNNTEFAESKAASQSHTEPQKDPDDFMKIPDSMSEELPFV